jgi:hypothetical protein
MRTPASKYPTMGDHPKRWVRYPNTSAPIKPPASVMMRWVFGQRFARDWSTSGRL